MLPLERYLDTRERPAGPAAMRQRWEHLTFLHRRVEPDVVRNTLPEGLEVDTFPDESGKEWAYLGLVPFRMRDIRFPKGPRLPYLGAFPETNVRTYVWHRELGPGVWFYSLDAARWLACVYARRFFSLPYSWASMQVKEEGDRIHYRNRRIERPRPCGLRLDIRCEGEAEAVAPGTLPFFVIERYQLFAERNDEIFFAKVHHEPYRVQPAWVEDCWESQFRVLGLPARRDWDSVLYSPGVEVEVFSLKRIPTLSPIPSITARG